MRVQKTRRRIAGHAEERLAFDEAEGCWLAGLDRDAMKQDLAAIAERVQNQVALADRRSARKHHHVLFQTIVERALEIGNRVRGGSMGDRCAAVRRHHGRNRESIDVVDLAWLKRMPWVDDFVAR